LATQSLKWVAWKACGTRLKQQSTYALTHIA
jgi:hypothetical protein